jgi:hypothetical protein
MSVLGCKAILILGTILHESKDENVLAVTAWTLGQIGKHSPEHAKAVASANLFPRLVQLYTNEESGEDLKFKCKLALKLCLQKCLLTSALEPLLYDAPPNILKYVLGQYSKVGVCVGLDREKWEFREIFLRVCVKLRFQSGNRRLQIPLVGYKFCVCV